jgi:hypothetical protein
MSVEILLLGVLCGLTIIGYMIAINAHGPIRLSVSYLLATVLLAGSVIGIVQYVNSGLDQAKMATLHQMEMAKQKAENQFKSSEEALRQNKEILSTAARINGFIASGSSFATMTANVNLLDLPDRESLENRAAITKSKIADLKSTFDKNKPTEEQFSDCISSIDNGLMALSEAAQYYVLYYRSEDASQEQLRERIMRQKAKNAYDFFQKASMELASKN